MNDNILEENKKLKADLASVKELLAKIGDELLLLRDVDGSETRSHKLRRKIRFAIMELDGQDIKGELNATAMKEFEGYAGKVIRVKDFVYGFQDHDFMWWQIDRRIYPDGIRVRVVGTPPDAIQHWNDDEWLDPIWNVEPIDWPEEMKFGRSFWIHPTSYRTNGEVQAAQYELAE